MTALTLLLFDIDGTLISSGGSGIESCNRAFLELFGVSDAWGQMEASGKTDHLIFQEIAETVVGRTLTTEESSNIARLYLGNLKDELNNAKRFRVLPGVSELCSRLQHSAGYLVGLETGNLEPAAYMKLNRGLLSGYFSFGGFGSDSPDRAKIIEIGIRRGQAIAASRGASIRSVVVIGDTRQDIEAGKSVGATTIAVATGRYDLNALAAHNPDHLFEDLGDSNKVMDLLQEIQSVAMPTDRSD